ncbi:hypothetical protein V5799_000206 [Amblyomma americanum]|uniref:Uncharacterized protein n=1 Tax=Amblyomma americanum TaxID=6943 RepID=A0AAQ4D3Q2_AMBAM
MPCFRNLGWGLRKSQQFSEEEPQGFAGALARSAKRTVVQVFDSQVTAKAVAQPRPPNERPLLVPRVGSHHVDHSREG